MIIRVDDVAPAAEPLPTRPLAERWPGALAILGGADRATVEISGGNPLLMAVHLAFAGHRPLVLSPDAIWLCILQGIALHVAQQTGAQRDALRAQMVGHTGRRTLEVRLAGAPRSPEEWATALAALTDGLADEGGAQAGWAAWAAADFSTSTAVEQAAARVVLLDLYADWYDYLAVCICGIPEVRLRGTPEDWRRIRARVERLPGAGLEPWAVSLRWVLDNLVESAEGRADRAFWQGIYKPQEAYGADVVTGWIGRLFPLLGGEGRYDQPNPLLLLPPGTYPAVEAFSPAQRVTTASVPPGPATATIRLRDAATGAEQTIQLRGGLLAVGQDDTGALEPVAGAVVLAGADGMSRMQALIDRIRAEHTWTAPAGHPAAGSAEMRLFGEQIGPVRFAGGARLYAPEERRTINLTAGGRWRGTALLLGELPDGGIVGAFNGRWLRLPPEWAVPDAAGQAQIDAVQQMFKDGLISMDEYRKGLTDRLICTREMPPEPLPVLADSFAELLERLADGDPGPGITREVS